MFRKVLKMELSRAFRPFKLVLISGLMLILLLGSDWPLLWDIVLHGSVKYVGIIEELGYLFLFDTFKCVLVVLLASVYTNSFCKDDNGRYLRMLLTRTDIVTYTQCRFIANFIAVAVVSIGVFYLYALVMCPFMPILTEKITEESFFYIDIVKNYPILYIGMTGFIFGLVAAASSSVGLLFSSYKPNSFVSIAISGLFFYIVISYIPYGTPLNVLNIVGMSSCIGRDAPWQLMFLWANVYMLSVVGICGLLFYRRMKWRVENGYV